jgi:hypothetical protein
VTNRAASPAACLVAMSLSPRVSLMGERTGR